MKGRSREYKTKSIHFYCENVKITTVQERKSKEGIYWVVEVDKAGFLFRACCFKESVKIQIDSVLEGEQGQKPARIEGFVSIAKGGTYLCLTKYVPAHNGNDVESINEEGEEENSFLEMRF